MDFFNFGPKNIISMKNHMICYQINAICTIFIQYVVNSMILYEFCSFCLVMACFAFDCDDLWVKGRNRCIHRLCSFGGPK